MNIIFFISGLAAGALAGWLIARTQPEKP